MAFGCCGVCENFVDFEFCYDAYSSSAQDTLA